jgi:hypothetical protein
MSARMGRSLTPRAWYLDSPMADIYVPTFKSLFWMISDEMKACSTKVSVCEEVALQAVGVQECCYLLMRLPGSGS